MDQDNHTKYFTKRSIDNMELNLCLDIVLIKEQDV